jgi:menaquinol-cytochrome c reductase iron-sulfur subunit
MTISTEDAGRRRFLARIVKSIQAAIGGVLGVVLGGSILSPSFARREENWLPAASLGSLTADAPTAVALHIAREDGYSQIVERRIVFLVRTGASQVTAIDPTCTHLGCRVAWVAESRELRCPCHGGVYDHLGVVKSGPPPAPLPRLATKIDGDQVLVQI